MKKDSLLKNIFFLNSPRVESSRITRTRASGQTQEQKKDWRKPKNFTAKSSFLLFCLIFIFFFFAQGAKAGSSDNVSGFAWSENIGWVSFNSENDHDPDTPGVQTSPIEYGIEIDNVTGVFSGFAWSDKIGWIKFDPAGPYPSDPPDDDHSVELKLSNNKVSGWARACAGAANPDCTGGTNPDSGDWDGWIKMRGTGPGYGVVYNPSTGEFEGWAWGSEVVGWLSFNHKDCDPDENGFTNDPPCPPGGEPISDYAVVANINQPPSASNLDVVGNYADSNNICLSPPDHTFSWTFSDSEDGTSQTSYELQADNDSDFSSPEVDVSGASATSKLIIVATSPTTDQLGYNQTDVYWRLKVFDSSGDDSGWISPNPSQSPFNTAPHLYPTSDFTFVPIQPSEEEEITFTENTVCFDINNNEIDCPPAAGNYSWDFDYEDAPPFTPDAAGQVVTNTYEDTNSHTVALDVTDAEDQTCRAVKSIQPKSPLPKFREISPMSLIEKTKNILAYLGNIIFYRG